MTRLSLLAFTALMATGCASLPKLGAASKATPSPAQSVQLPVAFTVPAVAPSQARSGDALLRQLEGQISNSLDVAISQARLDEARARLSAARAGLLPSIGLNSTASTSAADGAKSQSSLVLGTNFQVPLDFFGTSKRRVDAQAARAEEAAFTKARTAALSLATLRQLYISLRTAQAQISVTQANLLEANDSLSLATARQRAGLETGLGVAQATNDRDSIAARLPALEQSASASRLGIEALLGKTPQTLEQDLRAITPIPRFDLNAQRVDPAQWLRNRPDLVAAQRRLQAAGLEAEAAKRDRYPNVSLSGLITNTQASTGLTGAAGLLSANLVNTLFDFGRLDALAAAAGAQARTQSLLYQQAVTNAASDVETQASRMTQAQAAIAAQAASVASAKDQARLARVRYTSGLSDFLVVLTSQRAVFEAQNAQVLGEGELASAEAALVLALGL
jgi:outer membrane protein, multidrug efflux system